MACVNKAGAMQLHSSVSKGAGGLRLSSGKALRARVLRQNKASRSVSRTGRVCTATVSTNTPITAKVPRIEEDEAVLLKDQQRARAIAACVDPPTYNAEKLRKKYMFRPIAIAGRSLQIAVRLGSFGSVVLADKLTGRLEKNLGKRAKQFRERLTELGPTFIKVGQALSTRPDLMPQPYLEELTELQDALPCFSNQQAFRTIEEDVGRPLEEIYSAISPSPIAAASLGQVYKARLVDGTEVAVKVQRPNIIQGIELDLFLVRNTVVLVDKYLTSLNTSLTNLVDDFAKRVLQELNYVQEGLNCERFNDLYGDRPEIFVPGIFWGASSSRVLTMEWVEGIKLSEQQAIADQGLDILQLVDVGIQCSLRQLLEYGFFHADPHPGNLLATPDGRLAFLDFGMMSETPSGARVAIINHVVHLVNRDYEAMARDYYALDFLDPSVDVRPIVPALANFFDDVLTASVSELNFKTITDGLGAVLYEYPFNVPAYYALILRSLTVLEGLALFTDPNFKVLAKAYPYMARRLLTDPSASLRESLLELLFKEEVFRWGRLENLLREGGKESDFNASEVIKPIVELVLADDEDNQLRPLVESEVVRVAEALSLGALIEGTRGRDLEGVPAPVQSALMLRSRSLQDEAEILELRAQVLRVWDLLSSSKGFDPAVLQPLFQIAQDQQAQQFGNRVATRFFTRLTARAVREVLMNNPPPSTPRVATSAE
uniref:Protein kinase domain-containing protein n=1 Tax=Pyramimonas obovata TaxID=1411642 RepID=A0A7S0RXD1_9CHLO|mmetsp:Transcript_8503/g.17624  ORF Transcript_8503/g.17624 Transcript_8503/m.17624 type:complete len:715 (+) Transcript_8503:256-2400(+)|eukprot:CAMPEP_0118923222 /NCGR_PEP_ID=MMETSP1169-20130426/1832_1 /TAXON_ID=36882 /ORGANISM="Pyramimonas obovata, Strain CCMP722" /LENGTH=714 /DNA_ID=CAMNT_0006864185 /DNA_START=221 /DNA_END=2365 /DNA_ORIENTATION=+